MPTGRRCLTRSTTTLRWAGPICVQRQSWHGKRSEANSGARRAMFTKEVAGEQLRLERVKGNPRLATKGTPFGMG